jgi:hypothetical protein
MDQHEQTEMPSEELYAALGFVVFHFGMLTELVEQAIAMHFDYTEDARVLAAGLRFPELVDRYRVLYKDFEHHGSPVRGVNELCETLTALNTERNREIHSTWGYWAHNNSPARSRTRLGKTGLSHSTESVSIESLRKLGSRMEAAGDKVYDIAIDAMRHRKSPKLMIVSRGENGIEIRSASEAD